MYILLDMIDIGLKDGEVWTSDIHRKVAQCVCLNNPLITTKDALMDNCAIINKISDDQIQNVTGDDLRELGCSIEEN